MYVNPEDLFLLGFLLPRMDGWAGAVANESRGRSVMTLNIFDDLDVAAYTEAVSEPLHGGVRSTVLQDFLVANYNPLRRRLVRHLGCGDLASECLHDAWIRLGKMMPSSALQNYEAYVYRVACNAAMDSLRNSGPWQRKQDADMEMDSLVDCTPGPDTIAEARSDLKAFERAVGRLPRRHYMVLIALRIDEMTRHEVAARYDLSLRGVDTALRQALDYCAESTGHQVMVGVTAPRGTFRLQPVRA